MFRELVWVEKAHFHGWACSACAWEFKSLGPPIGNSLDEMKQNYERLRDKGFRAHDCAEYPKGPAK
jgi:hypothetical protein